MSKRLPEKVLQELQCLLAVEGCEMTMGKEGEGLKGEEQDQHIDKTFHGSHGYSSILDKFWMVNIPMTPVSTSFPLRTTGKETIKGRMVSCTS